MKVKLLTIAAGIILAGAGFAPSPAATSSHPGSATGIVTADGTPAANVTVSWFAPRDGSSDTVESGTDGSFTLPLPSIGTKYYLAANLAFSGEFGPSRSNDAYVGKFYGADGKSDYAFQLLRTITSSTSNVIQNVDLEPGGSVTGSSPNLANAHINLVANDGTLYPDDGGYADSSGAFSFTNYTPGVYRLYAASHGTFAPYLSDPFTLNNGDNLVIDPTLATGASIQGTVTSDSPEQTTEVVLSGGNVDALGIRANQDTDENGHYEYDGLPAGVYTLTFSGGDTGTTQMVSASKTVHVIAGQSVTANDSLVTGGVVTGSVVTTNSSYEARLIDSAGAPVADVVLTGGSFQFSGIAPGDYHLLVADYPGSGWATVPVGVQSKVTSALGAVKLTSKPLTLSGTITGKHSGYISFSRMLPTGNTQVFYGYPFSTSGKYKLTNVLPGKYTITINAKSRQTSVHSLTVTKTTTHNYSGGPAKIRVTGRLELEGVPFEFVNGDLSTSDGYQLNIGTNYGSFSTTAQAGTYTSPSFDGYQSQQYFQAKTPYYFRWPASKDPILLKTGHPKSLGAINIEVDGGLAK